MKTNHEITMKCVLNECEKGDTTHISPLSDD